MDEARHSLHSATVNGQVIAINDHRSLEIDYLIVDLRRGEADECGLSWNEVGEQMYISSTSRRLPGHIRAYRAGDDVTCATVLPTAGLAYGARLRVR